MGDWIRKQRSFTKPEAVRAFCPVLSGRFADGNDIVNLNGAYNRTKRKQLPLRVIGWQMNRFLKLSSMDCYDTPKLSVPRAVLYEFHSRAHEKCPRLTN